jgi:hypothetical protein
MSLDLSKYSAFDLKIYYAHPIPWVNTFIAEI